MDILEEYYGKETFTLYALFAVVPGKKTWSRLLFITVSVFLLTFMTLFQVIKLVIEKFKAQYVIEYVPTATTAFGTLVYIPYVACLTEQQYKRMLSVMLDDLKEERSEEEDAIKREFAEGAKLFVKVYSIILIMTICGIPLSGFLPYFLDLIIPLNESREMELLANGEIFIDQEKYFTVIYIVECLVVFVVCVIIGVSENMSVIIGQHLCGMCAVIGYKLEKITELQRSERLKQEEYVQSITSKLRICIEDHEKLLQFSVTIASFYDIPLTFILVGSICTLTVSLVQVTDPELVSMKMVIFTISQVFQLFLVSRMGQSGIDATIKIAENAYNAKWDICPANVRRILQMIILRSSKPCLIMARGLYVLSIENFMSVIQTITSFYMVLRQA